jgi:hypothetical protein
MGPATKRGAARPRHVLLVDAFVVGWSVGRAAPAAPVEVEPEAEPVVETATANARFRRPLRLALAGTCTALVVTGAGLALRPEVAAAPLVSPAVLAREHAQAAARAERARLDLLRHLELAGINARRAGPAAPPKAAPPTTAPPPVRPDDRAVALDTYLQALGPRTILVGLDASRAELQQQVLSDPRVHIYPAGRGDVASGKLDVRILAMIEYLAQADGEVSVSCLISGHSRYVAGRPGVVSAHVYGRAVDVSAVGGVPILDHQGPGSVTERTIRQILALPSAIEPAQIISLMALGGPSFALADHYDHIHIGY